MIMYFVLATISATIFMVVPQCGAICSIEIVIATIIVACFTINIEARAKIRDNDEITSNSIYKKTTRHSTKIMAVIGIIVSVVTCVIAVVIFILGIILSGRSPETFKDGLAIIGVIDQSHMNAVGLPIGLVSTIIYCFATRRYVGYCLSKMKKNKDK